MKYTFHVINGLMNIICYLVHRSECIKSVVSGWVVKAENDGSIINNKVVVARCEVVKKKW